MPVNPPATPQPAAQPPVQAPVQSAKPAPAASDKSSQAPSTAAPPLNLLPQDQLKSLASLGQAGPYSFVDDKSSRQAEGLKPGSFNFDHELFKTSVSLEGDQKRLAHSTAPVRLKAESKLDERFAGFSSGNHRGELKLEGNFKASIDGTGQGPSAVFGDEPAALEGQLGLRQSFSGDLGRLKYQSQLFARQNISPLFQGQTLPEQDYGLSAGFSYSSGATSFGLDAAGTALGADLLTSRFEYRRGDTALSLSAGQERPVTGEAFSKYGAQLKLLNQDFFGGDLGGYVGGELRSLGEESLKAGLSYSSGRTRLGSELVSTGAASSFKQPLLSHSLAYQLGNGWDLKLGARPQAAPGEQRFNLGLQGKF